MISLCIPTYNRVFETLDSFSSVVDSPHISEILIHDDGSRIEIYNKLEQKIKALNNQKIKLVRSDQNRGAFFNKYLSVTKAMNDWVILLDSDNKIDSNYLDVLNQQSSNFDDASLYLPDHAKCSSQLLKFSQFSGKVYDKAGYKDLVLNVPRSHPLLNDGNYFFNKKTYIKAFEKETEKKNPYALDVLYMSYLWMKHIENAKFHVVAGLNYEHRLSNDSFWVREERNSEAFKLELIKIIAKTF